MNRKLKLIKMISTWGVGILCALAVGQAAAVSGAISTTTNLSVDPPEAQCLNGPPGDPINCNIYSAKQYVWFSGLPVTASLGAGTYFFAVLNPGGQADPNDCTAKNLSDTTPCDTSNTGAGDTYLNRIFDVDASGNITYPGTGGLGGHGFDPANNKIRVFGYDDTTNPGGVYILAICSLDGAGQVAGEVPGVKPNSCKYDAFKVQAPEPPLGCQEDGTGGCSPAIPPTITKDASGSYDEQYAWDITKDVDKTTITIINDGSTKTATFNYTVTVTRNAGTFSNVTVSGNINVFNANVDPANDPVDVTIDSVVDELLNHADDSVLKTCDVTGNFPTVLSDFQTVFGYTCDLGSSLPQAQVDNEATVSWSDQSVDYTTGLLAGSDDFTLEDVQFTLNNATDDCVDVQDSLPASTVTGTICSTSTFKYSNTVSDPGVGKCTTVNNTAQFTTDDTGGTGSASQSVQFCHYRAALTMGYWKNHAANSKSGGPNYSGDCSKLKSSSCSTNGVWTIQYLPQTLGNYPVSSILIADGVWGGANCSATTDQGAAGCLAGQLLAAKLNRAAGSCPGNPAIDTTIANADAFLKGQTVNGVVGINYAGPTGKYTFIASQRALAVSLKTTLDSYNNGNGC